MESKWKEVLLSDLVYVKHGYAFKGVSFSDEPTNDIVLTPGNFKVGGGFKSTKYKYYNGEFPSEYILNKGDVILSMTDLSKEADTLGYPALVPNCEGCQYLHNQRLGLVKINDENIINKIYLYYQLRSDNYRNEILANYTGTTVKHTSPTKIGQYIFNLPPLPEQKAIAQILSSLDNKIELNRQMNQTLEQMAQAMFKSWFVDFDPVFDNAIANNKAIPEELKAKAEKRKAIANKKPLPKEIQKLFPDEFELTEEMGFVPKGWNNKPLSDLILLIGGGTPKTSIDEYWNGDIPWFSVVDAPNDSDVFVLDTEKKVTQLGIDKSSTKLLRVGTTIISARGTVGKCAFVGKPMAMNQSCYGIVGKDGISDAFVYYAIRESVANLQQKGHGSVFNTITRDTFKAIIISFGDINITRKFDDIVSDYFDKIKLNLIAINKLTQLRDTLLPKLISGELRVPELLIEKE